MLVSVRGRFKLVRTVEESRHILGYLLVVVVAIASFLVNSAKSQSPAIVNPSWSIASMPETYLPIPPTRLGFIGSLEGGVYQSGYETGLKSCLQTGELEGFSIAIIYGVHLVSPAHFVAGRLGYSWRYYSDEYLPKSSTYPFFAFGPVYEFRTNQVGLLAAVGAGHSFRSSKTWIMALEGELKYYTFLPKQPLLSARIILYPPWPRW